MIFLDRDLKVRFFTPTVQEFFHITAADVGRPLADLTPLVKETEALIEAQSVINTGHPTSREVEGPNNTWFIRRILPYRTEESKVEGVVIAYTNISDIKAATGQIEAAQAYSESLINTLRRPMAVLDGQLKVLFANPAFYHTFDTDATHTVGRPFDLLENPVTTNPVVREFLDHVRVASSPIEECEVEVVLPALGRRQLLLKALRIEGSNSNAAKVLFVSEDVTEHSRWARALEVATKRAEEANLGKSRFLAAASHDLRQPLQTMSLLRGLLAIKISDRETLHLVERLDDTISIMSGMLNTLLDINQLESGIVRARLTNFRVGDLLKQLDTEFIDHARARGLGWRVVPCSQVIHSDQRLLAEILRNLISNALKYTRQGRVLLGCRRRGASLRIEIWDTGIGIPDAEQKAIFSDFHQLDNPDYERNRGSGLGLPIVRRLAELLDHRIDVGSTLRKGSVFSIEVPLEFHESELTAQSGVLTSESQAPPAAVILVVEDDPEVRDLLELVLGERGRRVSTAADGLQALALVTKNDARPDLVVADYNLPGPLNGLQTIERLQQECGHKFPAIVLTGDLSTTTLQDIGHQHAIHLTKPVKPEALIQQIDLLLSARKAGVRNAPETPRSSEKGDRGAVFVIDDDVDIVDMMRELLEARGWAVETYLSCEAFLKSDHPGRTGCVLVDALLPGMSGLDLLRRLKQQGHRLPAIMVTGHGDIRMAVDAMAAGALDFIQKPVRHEELFSSLERALESLVGSPKLITWRKSAVSRAATLTRRQRQVLELVLSGLPSKNIAADLGISQRTVENHRAAIMKKMGAASLPELIRLGLAAG